MKVVMDKAGRIYIPKAVVESMNITLPCDVNIYVNTTNNTMIMSLTELDSIKRQIQKRLNKGDITKSERNFLNNLLTINEIENGKDREVKNDKD